MQTLQTQMQRFRIIEWSELDRPTVYRIVDLDNNMIAKVNGPANVPACQKMIDALENYDRMKSLLRNRLVDILRQNTGSSMWSQISREIVNSNPGMIETLIQNLKSQCEDSPTVMTSILGGEAVQILQVL